MSQALHTSSTGINSGQAQINVIAHNVANINTTAYKSANLTFETLHSHNLSYGSAATKDGGGTNPKQIGLGVKVGGITRNFTNGSFVSTGRNLDTMISGNGFYVVQDAGKAEYFTRDGIFSVDSAGNLVTQSGMKVMGAKSTYSNAGSDKSVKIPKNMNAVVKGDSNVGSKKLSELNNASITEGKVAVVVTNNSTGASTTTLVDIPDANGTVTQIVNNFDAVNNMSATDNGDGTISYSADSGYTVSFASEGTTSNFLAESGWANSKTSNELNQTVALQDMVNYNSKDTISLSDVAVDENGILIATYNSGAVLTQYVDDADVGAA